MGKPTTEFHKGAGRCKPCAINAAKVSYLKNKEKEIKRVQEYQKKKKEQLKSI